MKDIISILLLTILCHTAALGQDASGNRRKIINMVLLQSHVKANADIYSRNTNTYAITSASQAAQQGFRSSGAIPRYCLAKGAVICRLEEYVQLHSPFKLNIGVGGE